MNRLISGDKPPDPTNKEPKSETQEAGVDPDMVSAEQPTALPHEGLVVLGLIPELKLRNPLIIHPDTCIF